MRIRTLLVGTLAVLASCDLFTSPDEPALRVELPAAVFSPGDPVSVTLRNDSESPWYFVGVCNDGLQRRENGRWVQAVPVECRMVLQSLSDSAAVDVGWLSFAPMEVPAGGAVTTTYTIPADAALGQYRIGAPFRSRSDGSGTRATGYSPAFNVFFSGAAARQP